MWSNPAIAQTLWDGLMVGVCLVDRDGDLTHMNLAGSQLLGWGAAFPTHASCHDLLGCLVPSDSSGREVCPLSGLLLEKRMVWIPRTRLRTRQGTWCWVELKGLVVDDVEASGYLLMFRDLSSEVKLTEESSRLASIPQENPFPVIEVDATGHLLYANPSMVRLMKEAHIGQDGFSTALPERFSDLAARCLSQGHLESHIEVSVGDKQYSWTFSPHPELGLLRGYGMDITEPKRAADEMSAFADTLEAKNQELDHALIKAESATRAKAAFLAVMSHEIRTPLNGVIGMAELLLQSSLDHEQQECTKIIRMSGEGLLNIINDILDFSKIESGQLALETIGFKPVSLLEEVVDLFSERAHRKGIDVVAYVDPDVPSLLVGDPHRLRQILSNYISNALKFTMEGSVLVRATMIDSEISGADLSPGGNDRSGVPSDECRLWIRLSVEDTGIGMSDDVQGKIFQVFTQADSSMSRKFGGSGLGLAICKQLVELMNGAIGVKSQPSQGSTFWCDIPFRPSPPDPSSRNKAWPLSGKVVWVLCPLKSSAWVITQLLQEMGAQVIQVDSIHQVQMLVKKTLPAGLGFHGLIVDGHLEEEKIGQWIETSRCSTLFRDVKIWSLKPFWLHKDDEGKIFPLDGMITLPIHREQFYQCLLGETGYHCQTDVRQEFESPATEHSQIALDFLDFSYPRENEGPSVLVVEDNPVNQAVAGGMLRKLGCQVIIVETGIQALQMLQEMDVDCIFMDLELPEMDGFATTRVIRELESTGKIELRNTFWSCRHVPASSPVSHIPILGMTAHVLPEYAQQCLQGGMDECLSKPVHIHDFQKVLQRWVGLELRRAVSPPLRREDHSVLIDRHPVFIEDSQPGNFLKTRSECQPGIEEYDVIRALKAMEGDEALLYSLFQIFNETTPDVIQKMQKSIHIKDRQAFQMQAHQLKGALSAVHARQEAKFVERLEHIASVASFVHLQSEMSVLENMMQKLVSVFQRLVLVRGD